MPVREVCVCYLCDANCLLSLSLLTVSLTSQFCCPSLCLLPGGGGGGGGAAARPPRPAKEEVTDTAMAPSSGHLPMSELAW